MSTMKMLKRLKVFDVAEKRKIAEYGRKMDELLAKFVS